MAAPKGVAYSNLAGPGLCSLGGGTAQGETRRYGPQAAPDGRPPALCDPFVVGETW